MSIFSFYKKYSKIIYHHVKEFTKFVITYKKNLLHRDKFNLNKMKLVNELKAVQIVL